MELKLNIYKSKGSKEVENTYIANDFELSTGVCEDLMNIVNIDLFEGGLQALSKQSQVMETLKIMINGHPVFKDILKEIFEGLTDEEIKRTKMSETTEVIFATVRYALTTIFSAFGGNSKN